MNDEFLPLMTMHSVRWTHGQVDIRLLSCLRFVCFFLTCVSGRYSTNEDSSYAAAATWFVARPGFLQGLKTQPRATCMSNGGRAIEAARWEENRAPDDIRASTIRPLPL